MDRNKSPNSHDGDVSNEKNIRYISVESLETMAALRVIGELWKQPDIILDLQEHVKKFGSAIVSNSKSRASFKQMAGKVIEKLSSHLLPLQLKETALNMIRPVGLETLKWVHYGFYFVGYPSVILTMNATFLKIRALEIVSMNIILTRDGTFSKRGVQDLNVLFLQGFYENACIYCSEDHVARFWKWLSRDSQKFFCNRKYINYSTHLIAYWTCFMTNELHNLYSMIKPSDHQNIYDFNHSIYMHMFSLSVLEGNSLAVKYFWPKLTKNEISNNIMKWTKIAIKKRKFGTKYYYYQETNVYTDVLCFLLSQMNNEEQRKIFPKYSEVILEALFSNWPWQKFLLPTIRVMWDYLEEKVYLDLLSKVSREIKQGRTTEKLLRNLLSDSPVHLKKCFVQNVNLVAIVLQKLLQVEDTITIKQILNYATTEEKKRLIYAVTEQSDEIFHLMYTGKLYLLSMLIDETLSLESGNVYFKTSLVLKHGKNLCHGWIYSGNWQTLDKFLTWAFSTQSQISNFKRRTFDSVDITAALVRRGDYELADKFMIWYFNSKTGISRFKKKLLYGELKLSGYILGILELLCDCDWDVYEKLIKWCCKSENDIRQFRVHVSQYDKMESIMRHVIGSKYNFEFAEKLLLYCFDSYEKVKRFKSKFSVSEMGGMEIVWNLVKSHEVNSEYNNWELLKELLKWLHPLGKSIITEMKKHIERDVAYASTFRNQTSGPSLQCKKQALFHLLDSFAQDQNESNNEGYSSNDDHDVTCLFDEIIEDDSDDSSCSINTDVVGILSDIMDISTDNSDENCDNFECEVLNEEDMDVV